MKVSNIAPFGVRMPPDLKQRLEISAKNNNRSLNAEVVFWLQKAMDELDSGDARHAPFTIVDGLGGSGVRTASDNCSKAVLEQMKLLISELERQSTKK